MDQQHDHERERDRVMLHAKAAVQTSMREEPRQHEGRAPGCTPTVVRNSRQ
jgi:hypothetical protein